MAIEITPKAGLKKNLPKIALLIFSVFLFIFILGSYFYLNLLSSGLTRDIEEKERSLARSDSENELEQELLLYQSKITLFKKLLSSHKKPANVFVLLEKISHPDIWFSNFNFNSQEDKVVVSGNARSFVSLGQQLIILKEDKTFKEVNLSDISMGDGDEANFSLEISFEPEAMK